MIFEGDRGVIDAIKEKKRLQKAGEAHDHIKPLVFVDGGLMKGAYGVGAGLALEELNYNDAFSAIVGVSSGAPSAAYFAAKETWRGASLVWEECCSRDFINPWRIWNQVDTEYLRTALEHGEKAIDTDKALSSPTELYIAVSNFETAEPFLIKPSDGNELLSAIHASILLPNISSDVVTINDIRYVDGGFTKPHVLRLVIEQIEFTHLLIITNQDKSVVAIPRLERWLNNTLFRHRMPKPLRFAAHERKMERLYALEYIEQTAHTPYAMIWGDKSIGSFERDPDKVKAVVETSRAWWTNLLA